ncbi:hypothetical protein [Streptomyces mirabilis]
MTSLVAQLRQVASTLELSGDDAQDLEEEIDLLEQVGADPGRGPMIWRAIKRILASAIATGVAAGSELAVQAAIEAGSALFS